MTCESPKMGGKGMWVFFVDLVNLDAEVLQGESGELHLCLQQHLSFPFMET